MCKPDIGYEVQGGSFPDWHDVGGFPNAPCEDPDVGYKFGGLEPGTVYTLAIRAYRVTDGVKQVAVGQAASPLTPIGWLVSMAAILVGAKLVFDRQEL